MTDTLDPNEFNTEFPPHSATVGRLPDGHPGMHTAPLVKTASDGEKRESTTESGGKSDSSDNGPDSNPDDDNPDSADSGSGTEDNPFPDRMDTTGDGVPDDHGNVAPPPSIAAWAARILTVGTLAAIIAYLVYLCFRPHVPAQFDLTAEFEALEQRNGSWALPIRVRNASTESMGSVLVEVDADGTLREFQLTLMGEGETGVAEVLFDDRPAPETTTVRVLSYVSP